MADNTTITPGTGESIASDDISSVKYQRVKLIHGADGVNDGDVSSTNGFPIKHAKPTTADLTSASINAASSGDNTLVSGTASQTIRVFKLFLVCNADVSIKFKDGASTDLTGSISMKAGGSVTLDFDAEPWFVTSTANAFILNLSSAQQVSGRIYYTKS